MTHFVGLVVAETEAEIAALLQPFHEYECTGVEDQYVVDQDITEEARAAFATDTTECLRDADGKLHSFFTPAGNWDERFSRLTHRDSWDPTRRERFAPDGYEKVTVPTEQIESFEKWAPDYYGAKLIDGKIINRTNPNAHWDWWGVGGRWSDMVPEHNCLVEELDLWFPDYKPAVLIDADGWHAAKEWGWFGTSSPSDDPLAVADGLSRHIGRRVWVVDFHI